MRISQRHNQSLPSFIKLHVDWKQLTETPEWGAFIKAWAAGEFRVSGIALDVICSHYRTELSNSERGLLCGISDSLFSAVHGAARAA